MGLAVETIAGRAVNPGAALPGLQLTNNTNSSFTVRAASETVPAFIDSMWAKGATAGVFNLHSPRLHDNITGISFPYAANNPGDFLYGVYGQPVVPNDPLLAFISGGAAETDNGFATIWYGDLDGIDARLATSAEVEPRVQNIVTVRVTVSGAATLGDWSAGTPINATDDKLHADKIYALLGYLATNPVGAIAIAGADTGNLRVGGPGNGAGTPFDLRWYFVRTAAETGRPYIPLIKANNKGGTNVFQCDNAAGANNDVFLTFAELSA